MTPRIRPIPKEWYIGPDHKPIQISVLNPIEFASHVSSEAAGGWISSEWRIYLRNDISLTRRWAALRHELKHALIDTEQPI